MSSKFKNRLVQIGHLRELTEHFFALFNSYPPVGLTFMKSLAKSIIDIYRAINGMSSVVEYALYYMMPRLKTEHAKNILRKII